MVQSALEPFFPSDEEVPETLCHLQLRTALFLLLELEFAGRATVGSEQFVYWDRTDPKQTVAPDVIVHLGVQLGPISSWKTWEHGTPNVCVEIVSPSDAPERALGEKLRAYQALGVQEFVRFDPADAAHGLRQWLRQGGKLVEQRRVGPALASPELGLYWVAQEHAEFGRMLRLARDARGENLIPTLQEAHARASEARAQEVEAREKAEARVRELEAWIEQEKKKAPRSGP